MAEERGVVDGEKDVGEVHTVDGGLGAVLRSAACAMWESSAGELETRSHAASTASRTLPSANSVAQMSLLICLCGISPLRRGSHVSDCPPD